MKIIYVIRRITEDGLVKLPDRMSEWLEFDTPEDALKYAKERDLCHVFILSKIMPVWE